MCVYLPTAKIVRLAAPTTTTIAAAATSQHVCHIVSQLEWMFAFATTTTDETIVRSWPRGLAVRKAVENACFGIRLLSPVLSLFQLLLYVFVFATFFLVICCVVAAFDLVIASLR